MNNKKTKILISLFFLIAFLLSLILFFVDKAYNLTQKDFIVDWPSYDEIDETLLSYSINSYDGNYDCEDFKLIFENQIENLINVESDKIIYDYVFSNKKVKILISLDKYQYNYDDILNPKKYYEFELIDYLIYNV